MVKADLNALYFGAYPDRTFSNAELKNVYKVSQTLINRLVKDGKLIRLGTSSFAVAEELSREAYREGILKRILRYLQTQDFAMAWITIQSLTEIESENNSNFLLWCLGNIAETPEELKDKIRNLTVKDVLDAKRPSRNGIRETIFARDFSYAKFQLRQVAYLDGEIDIYDELCLNLVEMALKKQNTFYLECLKLEKNKEYDMLINILRYVKIERGLRLVEECLLRLSIICSVSQRFGIVPRRTDCLKNSTLSIIDNGEFERFLELSKTWQKTYNVTENVTVDLIKIVREADDASLVLSPKTMYAFYDMVESFGEDDIDGMLGALREYLNEFGKPQLEPLLVDALHLSVRNGGEKFKMLGLAFSAIEGTETEINDFRRELYAEKDKSLIAQKKEENHV